MKARCFPLIGVLIPSAVLLAWLTACSPPAPEAVERHAGESGTVKAPDLVLRGLDGSVTQLSDHKGKVVVLNFWATWCPPCRAELPHFADIYRSYKDKGVVVIGVSFDHEKNADDVRTFAQTADVPYPIAKVESMAEVEEIDRSWSGLSGIPTIKGFGDGEPELDNGTVQMMPTTFVIDKAGYIYRKHVGPRERRHLEPELRRLLGLEA